MLLCTAVTFCCRWCSDWCRHVNIWCGLMWEPPRCLNTPLRSCTQCFRACRNRWSLLMPSLCGAVCDHMHIRWRPDSQSHFITEGGPHERVEWGGGIWVVKSYLLSFSSLPLSVISFVSSSLDSFSPILSCFFSSFILLPVLSLCLFVFSPFSSLPFSFVSHSLPLQLPHLSCFPTDPHCMFDCALSLSLSLLYEHCSTHAAFPRNWCLNAPGMCV